MIHYFCIFLLIFTTTPDLIRCSCDYGSAVMCDNLDDILVETPQKIGLPWLGLHIGNKNDVPRFILMQYHVKKINKIKQIPSLTVIKQINEVEENLNLSLPHTTIFFGNNLTTPTCAPFLHAPKPRYILSLENNQIENIHCIISNRNKNAIFHFMTMNLARNRIKEIDGNTFLGINVNVLLLAHNELSLIRTPHGLPSWVRHLYMDHNQFMSISAMNLHYYHENKVLEYLTALRINHNKLHTIDDLPALKSLRILDVSFNNIYSLGNILNNLTSLRVLNLKGNKLTTFNFPNPLCDGDFYFFHLGFNRLRNLDVNLILGSPRTKIVLALSGNPWNCQCMEEMERIISNKTLYHHGIEIAKCDRDLLHSSRVPYCKIDKNHREKCNVKQFTEEWFNLFHKVIRRKSLSKFCDLTDLYDNEEYQKLNAL